MANKTMHHVVIGDDTFELIDEAGREETTALKEDLSNNSVVGNKQENEIVDNILYLETLASEIRDKNIAYVCADKTHIGVNLKTTGYGKFVLNGTSDNAGPISVSTPFDLAAGTYSLIVIGLTGYNGRPISVYRSNEKAVTGSVVNSSGTHVATFTVENDLKDCTVSVYTNRSGIEYSNYTCRYFVVPGTVTTDQLYQSGALSTYINNFFTKNEVIHPYDFSVYYGTERSASADAWWINDCIYHAGYIKSVSTYIWGDTDQTVSVAFIRATSGADSKTILGKWETTGHGLVTIPINEYIDIDFWVSVKASGGLAYYQERNSPYHYKTSASIFDGYAGNISNDWVWSPDDLSSLSYIIAAEIKYASIDDLKTVKYPALMSLRTMFVAGDSQTAGYPYNNNAELSGIYWWKEVERKLGYVITQGSRSGSGYLYAVNGVNAISITDNWGMSRFAVAVYAYGTNDYGNDIPIGTVDDIYPTNQTFAGAINYVITRVYGKNPKILLILATPINRSDVGATADNYAMDTPNNTGSTLRDYCEMIISICKKRGVMYIDRTTSPFNTNTLSALLGDGLHPNIYGYKVLGQEMAAKIGALISPYIEPETMI